jgi:microcystin-dependent protein
MAFWSWSKTPASNATADGTINWAEGQSPSSVNDSARAMMARTAEWRDDVSGTITTGGTSIAYTLTSNQGFDTLAHMNNAMIAFVPNNTNGAGSPSVTLAVDSLTAKPIRSAPSVEIPSGTLVAGTPYVVTYNNSDGAFYLQGFYISPTTVPVGTILPYTGSTAPNSSFALCYGQQISTTTYSVLYAIVGNNAFGTDTGGNFFLPDLRGRAIFGLDNMGGSAANRITSAGGNFDGTVRGGTGGAQSSSALISHTHTFGINKTTQGNISATGGTVVVNDVTANPGGNSITSTLSAGSGSSYPILSPAMTLPFILRII